MSEQKFKLEVQTLKKIYYSGETPAEVEAKKEEKRSDPLRYGVRRFHAEERRLKEALKKTKGQVIETYDFYIAHLVNEDAKFQVKKAPSDYIVDRLETKLEKEKSDLVPPTQSQEKDDTVTPVKVTKKLQGVVRQAIDVFEKA